MKEFKYRLYDLVLEHCPASHGFWLDGGEDKRVLELMERREGDIGRKLSAEGSWNKTLRSLRSPSFVDRIKDFFK
jgi:Zn-finger nucleic acid-binding protein